MLGKLEMSRSKIIASLADTPFGAQKVLGFISFKPAKFSERSVVKWVGSFSL